MKAFQVKSYSEPGRLVELAQPIPGNGQVCLRIDACALNFADLLMLNGTYQDTPEVPFIPGMEVAGTVVSVGPDSDSALIGRNVTVFGGQGGLAEYGCFPTERIIEIPQTLSMSEAAALQVAYGTAHISLVHRARLQPKETLLVLGAAGGVGVAAVEMGKALGARVIAVARGADKLRIAEAAGADVLIDSETDDIRDAVKELGGADVVFDPVGGDQFKAAFRATRPEGRIIPIGFAGGDVPQIPANHLLVKNISVLGVYWGGYLKFAPEIIRQSTQDLMQMCVDGRLTPNIGATFPLENVQDALDLLKARKSTGKIVVTTPSYSA